MADLSTLLSNLKETLIMLNLVGIVLNMILFTFILFSHQRIERRVFSIPARLNQLETQLKSMDMSIPDSSKNLRGRETEMVTTEAKKISQLWKSRKEQLQMGYWKKMEARAEDLKKLHEQKEHIEELIKRTKVKYHKREIDEESFREIVKDYQKQLMETNVKIWELEKALG
jgi:chromosome segregation ATPase